MPILWKLAHQRAFKETCEALKLTVDRIVIGIVVAGLYLFFVWNFEGEQKGWEATRLRLLASFAILLPFPFVYAIKFITALSKIYDEAKNEIKELWERLNRQPQLRLSYAPDKTIRRGNGLDQTFFFMPRMWVAEAILLAYR